MLSCLQQDDQSDDDETLAKNEGDDGVDGSNIIPTSKFGNVSSYENDYILSSNLGSYEDTTECSAAEDAQRHRSSRNMYDPTVLMEDFFP